MSFRYQLFDRRTLENEGDVPYRDLGRALQRIQWLNLMAGESRFSLRPVRSYE